MNNILTIEAAAEILQVHTRTVRRYIKEGKLQAEKPGGQWRITLKNLMDFMGIENLSDLANRKIPNPEERNYSHGSNPKVIVSAVVDIKVSSKEEALRLSSTVTAAMLSRDRNSAARCDYQFMEDSGQARFLLWGSPMFISTMVAMFDAVV